MYARTVKSKELTFQVSGMLWRRSLVMRDVETGSLWSHLLGKCMRGSLVGAELEMFPGTMTTWKEWRSRHPGTKVLGMSRTAKRYAAELWNNPKPYVFGVHLGAGRPSPAVALPELMKASVVNVGAAGHAVVVTWSPDGLGAQAFDRQHGGKTRRPGAFCLRPERRGNSVRAPSVRRRPRLCAHAIGGGGAETA